MVPAKEKPVSPKVVDKTNTGSTKSATTYIADPIQENNFKIPKVKSLATESVQRDQDLGQGLVQQQQSKV
jgi:hypothetical protein